MPFHTLPLGPRFPEAVHAVIEIPKGSSNKYEYDIGLGIFRMDRVLYSPLFYPHDYGFVPSTLAEDNDPLDILVLGSHPTFTGCLIEARPIGVLRMRDEEGLDEKIIGVAIRDPRYNGTTRLEDLADHRLKEVWHFFQIYKELEEKETEILGWDGLDRAYAACREAAERFESLPADWAPGHSRRAAHA